ncbi:MAG: hypothetical protein IKD01_00510 [Oscillospiraceae bacterium]|nr:hypothetical protein [Oscillospiraceae bacterium]
MALSRRARRRRIIVKAVSYALAVVILYAALIAFCGFASLILSICGVL